MCIHMSNCILCMLCLAIPIPSRGVTCSGDAHPAVSVVKDIFIPQHAVVRMTTHGCLCIPRVSHAYSGSHGHAIHKHISTIYTYQLIDNILVCMHMNECVSVTALECDTHAIVCRHTHETMDAVMHIPRRVARRLHFLCSTHSGRQASSCAGRSCDPRRGTVMSALVMSAVVHILWRTPLCIEQRNIIRMKTTKMQQCDIQSETRSGKCVSVMGPDM